MKKLLATAFSALAVLFGAASVVVGDVSGSDETQTIAIGVARPGGPPGPDGVDPQHNETLVRDQV